MRSIIQCILWVSLFIGFIFLTIYQIDEYVIQGKLLENGISISVSILGMALTMPTIIDKIRIFYNNAYSKYEKDIEEYLFIKTNKYSISRLYVFLKDKFKNLEIKYNIIKFLWITDQKDKVVIIVYVCLLIPMVFYVIEKFEIVLMN